MKIEQLLPIKSYEGYDFMDEGVWGIYGVELSEDFGKIKAGKFYTAINIFISLDVESYIDFSEDENFEIFERQDFKLAPI